MSENLTSFENKKIDDECLKENSSKYFKELLQRVHDIIVID